MVNTEYKQKRPILSNEAFYLAERTGLSYTSAGRGIACKRFPSRPAGSRAGGSLHSAVFAAQKQKRPILANEAFYLAERTGLEPATPGVTGRYSNQLNYRS